MAKSLSSLKPTTALSPPVIRVCATVGVGRTTFATSADKPVVLPTADSFRKTKAAQLPPLMPTENQ